MSEKWEVRFSKKATKQYESLKHNGKKPSINDVIDLLIAEIEMCGPERYNWKNYGKLSDDTYHCHLKTGHPTFIACWKVLNRKAKHIEVYYVGTHEGAPY